MGPAMLYAIKMIVDFGLVNYTKPGEWGGQSHLRQINERCVRLVVHSDQTNLNKLFWNIAQEGA